MKSERDREKSEGQREIEDGDSTRQESEGESGKVGKERNQKSDGDGSVRGGKPSDGEKSGRGDKPSGGEKSGRGDKASDGEGLVFWVMLAVIILAGYVLFFGNKLKVKTGQNVAQTMTFKRVSDGKFQKFDWKGKVTFIHFWATWCRVCRSELKHATQRAFAYNKRGIRYIMLNVDDPSLKAIRKILKEEGLEEFLSVHYSDALLQASKFFGVNVLPTLIMISPSGRLLHARTGIVPDYILEQWLQEVAIVQNKR